MDKLFSDFFKLAVRPRLRISVIDFLKEKHAQGYEIILVSASLLGIVKNIRDHLGFGQIIATSLEFKDGICLGKMESPVPYGIHKLEAVENFIAMNGFEWEGSCALGDHISDRMLLERVTYPIAVHPEPRLRVLAQEKGWKVL
jgi:HAD superfamily phosphoserine phosphatase-like hydrolase